MIIFGCFPFICIIMVYFSSRYGETNRRREDNLLFTVLKRSGHAVPQRTTQCDTEVGGRNTWVQKTVYECFHCRLQADLVSVCKSPFLLFLSFV